LPGFPPSVNLIEERDTMIRFVSAFGVLLLSAAASSACGGFFCSFAPMNQVSERILFVDHGDSVTTHVQIAYTGTAADFAWILPVPSRPSLAISHNELFRQLGSATRPEFLLEWGEGVDDCGLLFPQFRFEDALETADGGVTVVAEERVGPYETVVLTADDAEAVIDWLVDNGYQLGTLGPQLLAPYIDGGMHFLALRLAPDRELGDLQPIAMTYAADTPMIPIQLTAIATEPDLGVTAWILGAHRAVPVNYQHVQINEALVDWFNGGINYDDVVTAAVDEAEDGLAFVTDYAGPSSIMSGRVYPKGRWDLDALRGLQEPGLFIEALLRQGFPRDVQMQALLRRHVPMPADVLGEGVLRVVFDGDLEAYRRAEENGQLQGLAERAFYNDYRAFEEWTQDLPFDPDAFVDDLDASVATPLQKAQALFDRGDTLTRLYTTLSAEEMTRDPVFDFNPDLPEVSNLRVADARWECDVKDPENVPFEDLVLVVTLRDGREVRSRPFADGGGPRPLPLDAPAAAVIEQMRTSGDPQPIRRLTATTVTASGALPAAFTLDEAYPNPFNAAVVIPFQVPDQSPAGQMSLRVYNLLGQPVRTLLPARQAPGRHLARWDGLDASGAPVASGVYVVRLETSGMMLSRKLLYLR
jgi:hypothetical protein